MGSLLIKTSLGFLIIPLLTLALEPSDPRTLCERFLGDHDKAQCVNKVTQKDLDWYAASACGEQEDDGLFLSCIEDLRGAVFNPEALELCSQAPKATDASRLSCLQKIKNKDYSRAQLKKCSDLGESTALENCLNAGAGRLPAAAKGASGFQSLEIRK